MSRVSTIAGVRGRGVAGLVVLVLSLAGAAAWAPRAFAQAAAPAPAAPVQQTMQAPADARVLEILKERIDTQHQSIGIVVGLIDASGRRTVAYGGRAKGGAPVNGDTVFEIGSITKVFTSLLLADMVARGDVALTDPVQKYLPADVKVPQRGGRQITLADLATHTSGLPRLPENLAPKNPVNPYADYTVPQLYAFLSGYTLTRDIGARYEYSNLGVGLLGQALARRAGMDYEALVRARITGPLGMKSTAITLSPDMQARAAAGHTGQLDPTPYWDLPTLAGAGALRSTANDMLTFLAAPLGYAKTPLAPALDAMLHERRPMPAAGMEIALGWHILTREGDPVIWHNGGTGGFRTFIGYVPKSGLGIVVLSNTSTAAGVDDIGMYLLGARQALAPPPPPAPTHTQVSVEPAVLEGYVGRYQLTPALVLGIVREGARLFAQATGQGRFEIYPESDRTFFAKVAEIQIAFQPDAKGRATSLTLQQGGGTVMAKRIEGDAAAPGSGAPASGASSTGASSTSASATGAAAAGASQPGAPASAAAKARTAITVDPALLDRYAGRYQLTSTIVLGVMREGDRLFTQLTGQPRFELFAETERDFFLKVVDAQLTFIVDAQGRATQVVLHQNGMAQVAKRIE